MMPLGHTELTSALQMHDSLAPTVMKRPLMRNIFEIKGCSFINSSKCFKFEININNNES